MPSVEVSDDGTVGVTYYSFENDVPGDARSDADVWFIHCHPDFADCNAPDEWSDSKRLTATSFDYQAAPDSNRGYFLGDYVGLAAAGSDFFALPSITTDSDPADAVFPVCLGRSGIGGSHGLDYARSINWDDGWRRGSAGSRWGLW